MGIKNLTEAEEKEFYRLVEKMNGKEPDKKQNVKVKKPECGTTYHYIDSFGQICTKVWGDKEWENRRWELGNVFFTKEEAEFAREKKKVEVELERYADEYNSKPFNRYCYCIRYEEDEKRLLSNARITTEKLHDSIMFTSRDIVFDAIEAVGKERILKYIFRVESEGEINEYNKNN